MNWKSIEKAIRAYAKDHKVPCEVDANRDVIADVRDYEDINLSELARAIEHAVVVRIN